MIDIEDPEQLRAYMGPATSVVLRGGVSNKTVLVELPTGDRWVLKQALPQLRVAVDWFCSPDRIDREAQGLQAAAALLPGQVPQLTFHDPLNHVLGMEAVPEPHENWKTMLLRGEVHDEHIIEFARMLRTLHNAPFNPSFKDTSFFETLRLEPYYLYTAQQCPQAAPFLYELVAATRGRRLALVHGDYSPKNVLVHQGRLVLLDFEVMHWGDPAFDVGFALAHFLSKAHFLRSGAFRQAAHVFQRGANFSLRRPSPRPEEHAPFVRHTLGCLLARVAGRSTLEYFTPDHCARQREVVLRLMHDVPQTVPALIDRFTEGVA
jgi:aminoglycoside phosphotransferase (APT) family kinase protein